MAQRILFLARHLDSGGVTMHMMTLAQGLQSRGWEVALASCGQIGDHSCSPEWFEAHGVRHFGVPFIGPHPKGTEVLKPVAATYRLDSIVRTFGPSLIHVHWRSTSPYAAAISKIRRLGFVSTLHAEGIPSRGIFRAGSFWGDQAIAVSSETKTSLISDFGVPEEKVSVVFNGVDPGEFRPPSPEEKDVARANLGLPHGKPIVSLLGRLEQGKGHHVLLKAAHACAASLPELQVVFAGEGSLRDALGAMAQELGVGGRTHFLGHSNSRDVLWASDVSVLPSSREGFGIVVVEAMLCGVPTVRTPAGGAFDQIQDGENGYLVPFDDHLVLAERVASLARDRELAAVIAKAALARALGSFTVEKMVDDTERVYAAAASAVGRSRKRV